MLQQVLDRNSAFQRYACSDEFLCGAIERVFATIELPVDTAIGTARALMSYKPRTGAAALALVNKASYAQALFRRRQAHATMLDHLLPITRGLVVNDRKEMIGILYGIIVSNEDFSSADLCRMAKSPTLPGALVAIMFRRPHDFLYLVSLFCQAVGMHKIRSYVVDEIVKDHLIDASTLDGTGNDFLLSMLEQSFPPDQEHLLPFIEKELNYDSINSAAAKLFIGYEIPPIKGESVDITELASWCVENNHPGVLIAFHDIYLNEVIIDFKRYTGAFIRSMMDKIPLLKNASKLYIKGIPDYEDALVLYRALGARSILKKMYIDKDNCGPEFDFIMQGLSLNRGITKLALSCMTMSDPPAICDMLASLLQANRTIELINIALYGDSPEFPELTQLAALDGRLNLEYFDHVEPDETSSDSDEAPAQ